MTTHSNAQPLVSVIIPAYNCSEYINDALESISNQTYKNIEIVVVDDRSTDGTWELINQYKSKENRLRPFRNSKNLKIAKTLNRAISESKGKYLARMDGDDIKLPTSIEKQVAYMESNEGVVIVGTNAYICDEKMNKINEREYAVSDDAIRIKIFRYSPFTHASILLRASAVPDNPYQLDWVEDYDLYFRLGKEGKFANIPEPLYLIRTHADSVSQSKVRTQEFRTLYIRLKAVFEYGYTMSFGDKLYFFMQLMSMFLIPSRFKFWIFNALRRYL